MLLDDSTQIDRSLAAKIRNAQANLELSQEPTMSTPDVLAIQNFMTGFTPSTPDFNSSEYLYAPDYNQGSFAGGIIKVDTLTSKDQFWIPADSYIFVPITVTSSSSTPLTSGDPIAWRQSILSLVTGITVNSGSGQTLVNDQSIQYINHIRRLLECSWESQQTNMNELSFVKDTSLPGTCATGAPSNIIAAGLGYWTAPNTSTYQGSPQGYSNINAPFAYGFSQTVGVTGAVGAFSSNAFVMGVSPYLNAGMDKRIQLFKTNSSFSAGTYSAAVFLPLRYLHPFFEKLDFPVINTRFQILLYTASQQAGTALNGMPMVIGQQQAVAPVANAVAVGATMPPVNVAIGTNNGANTSAYGNTCFLYYRKVTYSPEDTARVGKMLQSGHTVTLEYPVCDYYPSITLNQAYTNLNNRTDLVSPSTVAPLRIWQLVLPAGWFANGTTTIAAANSWAPTQSGSLGAQQQVPFQTNSTLSRGNILVNSQRYYDNDLGANQNGTSYHDFYEVFEEQTIGHGFNDNLASVVGFYDFVGPLNLVVYDVSRIKDRLANPSEAVNLQCQYTVTQANGTITNNSDVLYLVERNVVAVMRFDQGAVSIAIGSQAA